MATRQSRRTRWTRMALAVAIGVGGAIGAAAQGLGGAGTVQGAVKDPTGGVMIAVGVDLGNPVTGFKRTATTDASGRFAFRNLAPGRYHLEVAAQGFETLTRDVEVNTSVPIELDLTLQLEGQVTSVEVVGHQDLVERDPTAHTDIDQSLVARLPLDSSSGLNQVITLASPGVVADSNGFFHPVGDHAQTQFSIDNQPVTDQQSRVYSNQISPDAVDSMEVITGVPPAEFGDKDSLVVRIVTKSGLDQAKPKGTASATYGSFRSPTVETNLGVGSHRFGEFLSASGMRTDRFLDPPEFAALNDEGNSASLFNRLDVRPNDMDALHLNVQLARSSFDVPNTYDQAASGQSQHQTIRTFNLAPGYTRILNSTMLLTANGYVRQDRVVYTPSANLFADLPATIAQDRTLRNVGAKVDLAYARGPHNVKVGGSVNATSLDEDFSLGLTDPTFNAPCVDLSGRPSGDTSVTTSGECAGAGLSANDSFLPGLRPYDLSRGGSLFHFVGAATIKSQAAYVQDTISVRDVTVSLGLRADRYDGLSRASAVEPRLGVSYSPGNTGTVLRASYGHTLETPYNENLVLSSKTGAGGLTDAAFGARTTEPLKAGTRKQFEAGVQQAIGAWLVVDLGYFDKRTTNAYDFDTLFDTPIVFPISWDHSRIDGFTGRINLVERHGFSAFTVFGHTNARFFNPESGGILFDSPLPTGVFRIDHDQKFQQTTNVQYEFPGPRRAWAGLTWRYDSGLVAGSVPDYATALTLSADQQAAIGLYCGDTFAAIGAPLASCGSSNRGATRIRIPADGTQNDDTNPARIAPRHLFDLAVGSDDLLRTGRAKVRVRFTIVNLANKVALYNFLSTFSGTHFVTPRAYQLNVGVSF